MSDQEVFIKFGIFMSMIIIGPILIKVAGDRKNWGNNKRYIFMAMNLVIATLLLNVWILRLRVIWIWVLYGIILVIFLVALYRLNSIQKNKENKN